MVLGFGPFGDTTKYLESLGVFVGREDGDPKMCKPQNGTIIGAGENCRLKKSRTVKIESRWRGEVNSNRTGVRES